MLKGKSGALWQAGDEVFVPVASLPPKVRGNATLVREKNSAAAVVSSIDDATRKIVLLMHLTRRSFVIGVGEIVPKVYVASNVLEGENGERGASVAEMHNKDNWFALLAERTKFNLKLSVTSRVTNPTAGLVFDRGDVVPGKLDEVSAWGIDGYLALSWYTRTSQMLDKSQAVVVK